MADSKYAKLLRDASRWLDGAQVGAPDHTTTQAPFGVPSSSSEPFVPGGATSVDSAQEVRALASDASWPPFLRAIYMVLGFTDREFTKNEWTFFSLRQIRLCMTTLQNHGQTRICDLASRYEGMGHFRILSIDTHTGKFFQRYDGGGNGYERNDNWSFVCALDLDSLDPSYFHDWSPDVPIHQHVVSAYNNMCV